MTDPDVLAGAEPFSAAGGPHGALVVHGFTGSPQSMRGLAEAFAAAGFTTELPRLPGHGTSVDDMATTTWDDWSSTVEAAYQDLASRTEAVVVAGLSMGGTLTAWLAARHPEIKGIVVINGLLAPDQTGMRAMAEGLLRDGTERIPGIGADIADPDQTELAYPEVPVRQLLSLLDGVDALEPELGNIRCPALVLTSPQDHVVPPASSDHFVAHTAGPVERVTLERSYHVATLDHDRALIEERAVDFARKVCA